MNAVLRTLTIENFRSLKGQVVIPLEAPVVLLHGSNGMGKTSVLSALELALTGGIAHLQRTGREYKTHLLHKSEDVVAGSIKLSVKDVSFAVARPDVTLKINRNGFSGAALLQPEQAKFFGERSYLAQATLGRLLELYEDADAADKASPLTKFVKDLLGLEQLDALVEGLEAAFHVARVRNLVPEFRRFEGVKSELSREQIEAKERQATEEGKAEERRTTLVEALSGAYPVDSPVHQLVSTPLELRLILERDRSQDAELLQLTRTRQELESLAARWKELPQGLATRDRLEKEQEERITRALYKEWQTNHGTKLAELINGLSNLFPDLPSVGDDPELARSVAEARAASERDRCAAVLAKATEASTRLETVEAAIQRSSSRLTELNQSLEGPTRDVQSLARALAGVVPHVADEICPVCSRDFSETDQGPLAAHIAASIAALTSEAGRLQELAQQRAEETNQLAVAQRSRMAIQNEQLAPADVASLTVRGAQLTDAVANLKNLADPAKEGTALLRRQSAAREALAVARRRDESVDEITREVERWAGVLGTQAATEFESIDLALTEMRAVVDRDHQRLEIQQNARTKAISELNYYAEHLSNAARHALSANRAGEELNRARAIARRVDTDRAIAKRISEAAAVARTNVVVRVFNTSLNKIWRDLFVRLAPAEQFVPAFKVPAARKARIEASLETVSRFGGSAGSPETMLSQGNLNTAALTLFLALHLSVPPQLPLLVLDDPVQSMDDVHVSQFAALLRTLSKTLGRQIIVAVHERALFDYLTLELSPAFLDDGLITIELSRNFSGESVATPTAYTYTPDKAIAA